MTDAGTLDFLAGRLDRVLTRLGAIEHQLTVLSGMAIRHDGALTGLATEFRGVVQATSRADHRLGRPEDHER